jgi:hypothetical protein
MATDTTTPDVTEQQLLETEAAKAQRAMMRTLEELRTDVQAGLDPRALAAKHPLLTLAAGVAAGFAAASVVVPAKEEERVEEKLNKFQAFLKSHLPNTDERRAAHDASHNGDEKPARDKNDSLLTTLLKEGFKLARPAILSALAAAVTAKVTPPSQPDPQPIPPDDRVM